MTVYATETSDTVFHHNRDCYRLRRGQELWDFDCDEYCTHHHPRLHRLDEMTMAEAVGKGKWPCNHCYPGLAAALTISPCKENFGHVPVDEYAGTEFEGKDVSHIVCARCIKWGPRVANIQLGASVPWPCTSAIVLGLVPRNLQNL